MMEHWIDRLHQERQRQTCLAEIFPVLVKALWKQLFVVLTDDLTKLRQRYPELIPESVQVNAAQPYSLRLNHDGYILQLTLNIPARTLSIQQITLASSKTDRHESERVFDTLLELTFDEQQQKVQFSFDEQGLSLEELSELCLRPTITRRPMGIAEIIARREA